MTDDRTGNTKNEGEGSRSAAREYNERTRTFVRDQDVAAKADEARAAVDGAEAEELKKAEEEGRSKARGLETEKPRER